MANEMDPTLSFDHKREWIENHLNGKKTLKQNAIGMRNDQADII